MSNDDNWFDALPPNRVQALEIDGLNVLLCNSGGTHYAVENNCTHQDTPLDRGRLRGGFICCPLHGVRFDLKTGEPKGSLTRIPLRTFNVTEQDGRVHIDVT